MNRKIFFSSTKRYFQDNSNSFFQSKSGVKSWNWVNFSHFETLNSTSRRLWVTICSVTARDITYVRRNRQNDSHGITVVTQPNSWKSNIFDPDSILKKKKIKRAFSDTYFLSKNKDFNNGTSLRMTKQEDISSCYFTIEETWGRKISYFGHAPLFLPDFDAFVWRLPIGTQANSQVCFRWMSKCVNKRGPGKFGAIPHEENFRRK